MYVDLYLGRSGIAYFNIKWSVPIATGKIHMETVDSTCTKIEVRLLVKKIIARMHSEGSTRRSLLLAQFHSPSSGVFF